MNDAFDDFLRDSLAPASGPADRVFVARVQSRIAIEERWQVHRRASLQQLVFEMAALAAVAAAILTLSRVPALSGFLSQSPVAALSVAVFLFGLFLVPLLRRSGDGGLGAKAFR